MNRTAATAAPTRTRSGTSTRSRSDGADPLPLEAVRAPLGKNVLELEELEELPPLSRVSGNSPCRRKWSTSVDVGDVAMIYGTHLRIGKYPLESESEYVSAPVVG